MNELQIFMIALAATKQAANIHSYFHDPGARIGAF
jgi:hypothetical protein